MARDYPVSTAALLEIAGVGEKKAAEFGGLFIQEVATYLETYPKVTFFKESPRSGPSAGRRR
jgi:hypothetical protein